MTVTLSLKRWARRSNRRRFIEAIARALPWIAAGAALVVLALQRDHLVAAVCVGVVALAAVSVLVARRLRGTWHRPPSFAKALDHRHRTADLLRTAVAIEQRGEIPDEVERVVLKRAEDLVPKIADGAVPPLRLRTSPLGLAALAVTALMFFTGIGAGEAAKPQTDALTEKARAKADEIAKALDALASDKTMSADVKEKLSKAKDALRKAATAKAGTEALAALSEASRLLDEAAPQIAANSSDEMKKLSDQQLADQLASAAAAGDSTRVSKLAHEMMNRAGGAQDGGAALGQMLKDAAAKASHPDPWGGQDASPSGERLSKLAAAGDSMKQGDMESAKSTLAGLSKGARAGTVDPRAAKLAEARRSLSDLRSATRTAMNGGSSRPMTAQEAHDAAAQAARDAASGKSPGKGDGSGNGSGAGKGMGKGMGMGMGKMPGDGAGKMPGTGQMPGMGQMPGTGQQVDGGNHLSVLQQGEAKDHGSSGTSGMKGNSPSGAQEPETVMAEEVKTDPPPGTPDGIVRAIKEHSAGEHTATAFGAIRDHYAAVAEAVMHRDEIPLTRRDFIQRYFEALRTREDP
jgi:hypothetical protein